MRQSGRSVHKINLHSVALSALLEFLERWAAVCSMDRHLKKSCSRVVKCNPDHLALRAHEGLCRGNRPRSVRI
jgi:hypothetical protein